MNIPQLHAKASEVAWRELLKAYVDLSEGASRQGVVCFALVMNMHVVTRMLSCVLRYPQAGMEQRHCTLPMSPNRRPWTWLFN